MYYAIIILFVGLNFLSCRPENKVTDFKALINAPIGEGLELQTLEEEDISFEYSIPENEQSIDLKISIFKHPSHGTLKDCSQVSVGHIKCTYSPSKDFFGIDTLELVASDGDVKGHKPSIITIEVINNPDPPLAFDKSFTINSKEELLINFPTGVDSDSLSSELSYNIISGVENGVLYDCKYKSCKYISNSLFEGKEILTYQITDSTGLISNTGTLTVNVNKVILSTSETFDSLNDRHEGVDIVWVIDNSDSMNTQQVTLKEEFESFINNFLIDGMPQFTFNMAVTTTDAYLDNSSNLFRKDNSGNQYDLSSTLAQSSFSLFKENFINAVDVGVQLSGEEFALASIEKAFSKQPTWYANNSHLLAYIILSDEKEQSPKTIEEYHKIFTALKNHPSKVLYYPIIDKSTDQKNRYANLASFSNNQVYDINSPFQTILDNISLNIRDKIKSFPLNKDINIIASTVKVSIDGNDTTNFTYENNSITLTVTPIGNSSIVVTYDYGVL